MKTLIASLLGAAGALALACGGVDTTTGPGSTTLDGTGGGSTQSGAGGSSHATGGSGGTAPASNAPTFSDVYAILDAHCSGAACHNPGSQRGVSLSSQAAAFTSTSRYVVAGNANRSSLYAVVSDGAMPPGGPRLSSTDLATIAAWIDAGAPND